MMSTSTTNDLYHSRLRPAPPHFADCDHLRSIRSEKLPGRAGQYLHFHFHAALFIYLLILTFLDETALVHQYSVLAIDHNHLLGER